MAKRLTDTEKWNMAWFRTLSPRLKAINDFLCDSCDYAGIWDIDLQAISFFINDTDELGHLVPVTFSDIEKAMNGKVEYIGTDKMFFEGFVTFQYKLDELVDLNVNNKVHNNVIERLIKYGIITLDFFVQQDGSKSHAVLIKNKTSPRGGPGAGPALGPRAMDMEKEMEMEEEEEKERERAQKVREISDPFFSRKFNRHELPKAAVLWNEHCGDLTKMTMTTAKWTLASERLLAEYGDDEFIRAVTLIAGNSFLSGQNKRKWKASFTWLIKDDNLAKVLVGDYSDLTSVDSMLEKLRKELEAG